MEVLSYGFKRPNNLDRGSIFFDALRDNITLMNNHTHNGLNSAAIPVDSFAKFTASVTNSGWTANGDGTFKKTVTMPGSFVWTGTHTQTYGVAGTYADQIIYPKMVKLTPTTFEVHLFVNNQALLLVFV